MTHTPPNGPARRSRRKVTAALLAAGAVGATTAAIAMPTANVTAAPGDTIQILSFNDYHGHIDDNAAAGTGDSGDIDGEPAGGGQFLAAKLNELRAKPGFAGSLTVAAGDNIGGSPFFSGFFRDEPSVESLNAMGLDVSGVGNHEFDDGVAELLRMQNGGCFDTDGDGNIAGPADGGTTEAAEDCYFEDAPYQGADFQWLAANVFETGVLDADGSGREETPLPEYQIETINGTDIAFIGMTLDGTDELVLADGIAGYTFADEVETANALVPEIRAAGVEAIIVLLHEGGIPGEFEIDGCNGVTGPVVDINSGLSGEIDAVISGHTQEPYNCSLPGLDGVDRPVVSAWEHGKVVTEMTFEVDAAGDVDRNTLSVVNHPVIQSELTVDPAVKAVFDKWNPLVSALRDTEVGTISADINRGGDPTGSDRGVESDAGNMVADAQLYATVEAGIDADIAFMNAGGIRSDLKFARSGTEATDGIVTFGESFTFQPFGNQLFSLPMTGAQIKAVLEEQCQPSDSSRPVQHLGVSEGFTYDLAITTQSGVCTAIEVNNVQLDGVDIVDADTYDVVVNNFLAGGGDNFDTFADISVDDRTVGPVDIDALNSYLDEQGPIAPPGTDRVDETLTTLPTPPTAVDPVRLLDSREDDEFTTIDGLFEGIGRLDAGETVELVVQGRGGISESAAAVNLQVGAILPDGDGFLTVYPCGVDLPLASSINFNGAPVVSNAVTSLVGDEGKVCIYTKKATDLYVDVLGYGSPNGSPVAVTPARYLDDREVGNDGTFDDANVGGGPLVGEDTFVLKVAGRGDVPADAKAVLLNVVAAQPAAPGFLAVFPCDGDSDAPPLASSVNYVSGSDFANGVITGVGADGNVCIFTKQTTNLVVDVNGYVPADGTPDPVTPFRLVDTRIGDEFMTIDGESEGDGAFAARETREFQVAGRNDIPVGATSAYLNVAAVDTQSNGYVTVYPCTDEVPNASNVNFETGETVANSVQVPLTEDGTVCVFANKATDFIMDITGFITPIVPFRPAAV